MKIILTYLIFCVFTGFAVMAESPVKKVGAYGSWQVYQYANKAGSSECFMTCAPSKSKGEAGNRGPVRLFVTNRQSDKTQGEVSFQSGYAYKGNASVTLKIDQEKYQMPTKDQGAWLTSPEQDHDAVAKMMTGKVLVVEGATAKGAGTLDEFPLSGFGKAYQALNKACPVQAIGAPAPVVDTAVKKAVSKKSLPIKKASVRAAGKKKTAKKKR